MVPVLMYYLHNTRHAQHIQQHSVICDVMITCWLIILVPAAASLKRQNMLAFLRARIVVQCGLKGLNSRWARNSQKAVVKYNVHRKKLKHNSEERSILYTSHFWIYACDVLTKSCDNIIVHDQANATVIVLKMYSSIRILINFLWCYNISRSTSPIVHIGCLSITETKCGYNTHKKLNWD